MSQVSYSEIKVQPKQAEVNANKPLVDFSVPSNNYDLSQCYLQVEGSISHSINPEINYTNPETSQADMILNKRVFDSHALSEDSAQAGLQFLTYSVKDNLVKNAYAESSKLGYLDNVSYHNSWRQNLDAVVYNEDELNSHLEFGGTYNDEDIGLVRAAPINLISRVKDEESKNKDFQIRLPLKNIFPSHKITNYQTSVHGDLNYHFETRLDNLKGNVNNGILDYSLRYNNNIDTTNNGPYSQLTSVQNQGANPIDIISRESEIKYDSLRSVPYHVGMSVNITFQKLAADGATVTAGAADTIIKKIELLKDNNEHKRVKFTFHTTSLVQLAANEIMQQIVMVPHRDQVGGLTFTNSLEIKKVELIMMSVFNPEPIKLPQEISLQYVSPARDTVPVASLVDKTFYIPPLTSAVFVVFPESSRSLSSFLLEHLTSYRFVIDNKPVADGQQIQVKSGKHYDLFNRALSSAGLRAKSIRPYFRNFNFSNDGSQNQIKEILILGAPVVNSTQMQAMQIELTASQNLTGNIQVVYYRNKVIKV